MVRALDEFITGATLVPLSEIDARLTHELDDWAKLVALHRRPEPWAG